MKLPACLALSAVTILWTGSCFADATSNLEQTMGMEHGMVHHADLQQVLELHEAAGRSFVRGKDGILTAPNPGQRWRADFDASGFTVRPDSGDWTWGLELVAYHRTEEPVGRLAPCETMSPAHGRLDCGRDGILNEWFINDRRGLEQGWTFARRPEGPELPLRLTLAVRGGLRPQASAEQVDFIGASGDAVLNYGGLKAWDADGRVLPARFDAHSGNQVRIIVDDAGARYPVTVDPVAQQAYVKASNPGVFDGFGAALAISGDTMVVGAPNEGSNATGVNGDGSNDLATGSGAAYVFVRSGNTWTQQAYLKASNTGAGDSFGWSVAISGDTIVVGALLEDSSSNVINGSGSDNSASAAGAAYVFVRSGINWTQQAYLKASNSGAADLFGAAVAIAGDTVVVGATRESSASAGVNGNAADNSAASAGAAYVFSRSGIVWAQQAYLKASDPVGSAEFGSSVALAGDTVVVGAPLLGGYSGAGYVFFRSGVVWSQQQKLVAANAAANARFGYAVTVAGDTIAVGARGEASAATGVDGNAADVSAPSAGAVYVYTRSGVVWTSQAYLKASNTAAGDSFGCSLALEGDRLVVGALGEDSIATGADGDQADNSASAAGAAYLFERSGEIWYQSKYMKASNTGAGDWFAAAVAVSETTVLVGSPRESSASSGINGNQSSNAAAFAGAAYGFVVPLPGPPEIVVEETDGPEFQNGTGTLVFPVSAVGETMSRSLKIRNTGTGPLLISGYLTGGAAAGEFSVDDSGMPQVLVEGAEGTLLVHFTGPAAGAYAATLQLLSNDADESPFDFGLSASAQTALALYDQWAAAAGLVGPAAVQEETPFAEGVANLLKYAFNMNGSAADLHHLDPAVGLSGLPVFSVVGSGAQRVFRAEYLRRKASGLSYLPMVSDTLLPGSFAAMTGTTTVTDIDEQWERVRIDQPRNLATSPRGFGRIEVTLP